MHLQFTPLAESDLQSIADFIARRDSSRALPFLRGLREQCLTIAQEPTLYRARPELGEGLRSCAHGRYVIFFSAQDTQVLVVRVLHSARDLLQAFQHP